MNSEFPNDIFRVIPDPCPNRCLFLFSEGTGQVKKIRDIGHRRISLKRVTPAICHLNEVPSKIDFDAN
jgi:hypothetical protein